MGTAAHNRLLNTVTAFPLARHFQREATGPCDFARFIILSPPLRGLEMVLKPHRNQRNWTLGSSSGVDFYIRDPSLLDRHLSVERLDDVWMISTNPDCEGCIVNGEPVETAVVEDGDRLLVGRFELVFLEGNPKA